MPDPRCCFGESISGDGDGLFPLVCSEFAVDPLTYRLLVVPEGSAVVTHPPIVAVDRPGTMLNSPKNNTCFDRIAGCS